jgi:hypothetical protein
MSSENKKEHGQEQKASEHGVFAHKTELDPIALKEISDLLKENGLRLR